MEKKEYMTPEMDVIELEMKGCVMLGGSDDQPGYNDEPVLE